PDPKAAAAEALAAGPALCDRCRRVGAAKGCPDCEIVRANADGSAAGRRTTSRGRRKQGTAKFNLRKYDAAFGVILRSLDDLYRAYGKVGVQGGIARDA